MFVVRALARSPALLFPHQQSYCQMYPYEIHFKPPTPFMLNNWEKLLPDWRIPPQSIAIVLIKAQFPLDSENRYIEAEKDRLLHQFLLLGETFKQAIHQQGFMTEVISPKDGKPQYSGAGQLTFDLVATVNYSLGFKFDRTVKGCKILKHPLWENAVYPGIFLSDAPKSQLQLIM